MNNVLHNLASIFGTEILRRNMEPLSFDQLTRANLARVARFKNNENQIAHPGGITDWDLSEWCLAAFGELGEAANLIKKMNRGESIPLLDLQREIADTVIYLDLLSSRAGFNLGDAVREKFNLKSAKIGVDILL